MLYTIEIEGVEYEVVYRIEEGILDDRPEVVIEKVRKDNGRISKAEDEQVRERVIQQIDIEEAIILQNERDPFDL